MLTVQVILVIMDERHGERHGEEGELWMKRIEEEEILSEEGTGEVARGPFNQQEADLQLWQLIGNGRASYRMGGFQPQ